MPRYVYEPYYPPCAVEGCDRMSVLRWNRSGTTAPVCRRHYQALWREQHPGYQQAWKAAHPAKVAEYRERYDRKVGRRRYEDQ